MISGVVIIMYYVIGFVEKNPDTLVKEDTEYLYYKEYEIYNRDSCIYKYHKPIIYDGEIVNKSSHIQGVPGKGGHWVYRTYIKYDGDKEHVENGMYFYSNHEIGDKVKITVVFYPYERIYSID
jgi:hypothetical protein